jgi:hypothetical protein
MVGWKLADDAILLSDSNVWNFGGFMWMVGPKTATEECIAWHVRSVVWGNTWDVGSTYILMICIH